MADRRRGRPSLYGFEEMKSVGDRKQYMDDDLEKIRRAALAYANRTGVRFRTKIIDHILYIIRSK